MNVAIFNLGETPKYLTSVNGAEYMADPTALEGAVAPKDNTILINPDITVVASVPVRYWKKVGTSIVEMSQAEKDAIAAAELQTRKDQANDFSLQSMKPILTALIKVLNTKLPANKQITKQELVDAIKLEIV